jgi:hypothetical protein
MLFYVGYQLLFVINVFVLYYVITNVLNAVVGCDLYAYGFVVESFSSLFRVGRSSLFVTNVFVFYYIISNMVIGHDLFA